MTVATGVVERDVGSTAEELARSFDFSSWRDLPLAVPPAIAGRRGPPQRVGVLERGVALIGMIMLSPVMAAVALAIKLDSPGGPVIYRQERVGLNRRNGEAGGNGGHGAGGNGGNGGNGSNGGSGGSGGSGGPERRRAPAYGRSFLLCKFRTMIPDAEKHTGPVWAAKRDPRVTRVGRVLRKLRLDEIPQLYNVLRGDMRLIGPRPERPHFVAQLCEAIPQYAERLKVPPGITGLAQVEREYDSSVDDVKRKIMYDLFYVRHWSRLLDAKIMVKTIDVALRGSGAR